MVYPPLEPNESFHVEYQGEGQYQFVYLIKGAGGRWDRMSAVTGAAQVVATADRLDALTPLTHARGVTASIGPYPVLDVPVWLRGQVPEDFHAPATACP